MGGGAGVEAWGVGLGSVHVMKTVNFASGPLNSSKGANLATNKLKLMLKQGGGAEMHLVI